MGFDTGTTLLGVSCCLWQAYVHTASVHWRLRLALVHLYHTIWGAQPPPALPEFKDVPRL